MSVRTISHFELTEKVGEGGAGEVWRAFDVRLKRNVALKFLWPHLLDSREAVERFRQEASVIAQLNHPNIETIHDVGEEGGRIFLVLEFLPGGSLGRKLRDHNAQGSRFSVAQVLECGIQIAEGMAYAHRHGVVHRDLKPANVLCTEEDKVKITDFGLAKYAFGEDSSGGLKLEGTIPYMAPEQVLGRPVDRRTDIHALGVILFELATGVRPYTAQNDAALLHCIVHDPVPSMKHLRPFVPEELDDLVQRAMAKDSKQRLHRMEEVAESLRGIREKCEAPTDPITKTITIPPPLPPPRPSPWLLALAFILAAAGGITLSWNQRCLWMPRFFEACALPPAKHVGIQLLAKTGNPDDRALLDGLSVRMTDKLRQMGRYEPSLGVHRLAPDQDASGLNLVVSGTLEHDENSIRVSATLTRPGKRVLLRKFDFEGEVKAVAALQDEMLEQIAGFLELRLNPDALAALKSGGTAIPAAFETYLRGLGLVSSGEAGALDHAIVSFRKSIESDRFYSAAYAALAEAYRLKHDEETGQAWLDLAEDQSLAAIHWNENQPEAHRTLGVVRIAKSRYGPAVESLQRALMLDPLDLETRNYLAMAREAQKDSREVEALLTEAVGLRPDCWLAHRYLGKFFFDRGWNEKARDEFVKVIALAPHNPLAYSNLGGNYFAMGNLAAAAACLEKALGLRPSGETYSNLGTVRYMQQHYAEAVDAMEEATKLGEDDYLLWGNLGEASLLVPEKAGRARGAFERAIELAKAQLTDTPNHPETLCNMANYYARLGRYPQALDATGRALKLAPSHVQCRFRAALVFEQAGKRDEALQALRRALEGGYQLEEVCTIPQLNDLRQDPRFKEIVEKIVSGGCDSIPAPQAQGGSAEPVACLAEN